MALRTFSYSGGKWTGQVTFCGVSLGVEVQCVSGSWSIKVGGQNVQYDVTSFTNIGGTDYFWFRAFIPDLSRFGIDPENCRPGAPGAAGEFSFYLPYDSTACPE